MTRYSICQTIRRPWQKSLPPKKNKISHRANALAKLAKDIDILIQKID
ncbi:hypothetical protein LMUR_09574 [Listeria grayi FSL F6-1183]|uniref:Non-canonical purine NTP pyrophosphatase n=1 Tax=Listeria grayi FSL F6-1183 TaxID=1265827 RepID=A0A829R5M1_LISGR|nr:hypothetical protein LMUR_09574 [Listeria grayi FSL F6-1183]